MVGVIVGREATRVHIARHGLTVSRAFELEPGVSISPDVIKQEDSFGSGTGREF